MPRIALGIEYNGAAFAGWQVQPDQRTVQGCVEQALSRVADHAVQVHCAGRTDAGVHASAQIVHFDSEAARSEWAWAMGANANLPPDVSAVWAKFVDESFHARYSARARTYQYRILNRPARPGLHRNLLSWQHRPLDCARMHAASQALVGEHDFSAYRAQGCQSKSPVRELHAIDVHREGDIVAVEVRANAFLHHMVRNIAGVLMRIGTGDRPVEWAGELLAGRDRTLAAATAPPQGLYLVAVEYPEEFGLP